MKIFNIFMLATTARLFSWGGGGASFRPKYGRYLKEKCSSEHCQQLSVNFFVKSFLIPKLLSKASSIQTTILDGLTLKHEWVKSQYFEKEGTSFL